MTTLRLLVLLAALSAISGCSDGCGNTVVSSKNAPGARHTAVLFQRDCGATSGFSTQIAILQAGKLPSGGGNAFIADDDHGAAQAAPWGGPWAELVWLSPQRLLVKYDAKARVFHQTETVSGVQIRFEPVARP